MCLLDFNKKTIVDTYTHRRRGIFPEPTSEEEKNEKIDWNWTRRIFKSRAHS